MRFRSSVTITISVALVSAADLSDERANLDRSRDPARLEAAATAIAASNDSAAITDLAKHLGERSFLNRLDPPSGSVPGVLHLGRVFRVLAEHPSPAAASLCIALAGNADFAELPARLNFVLNALAAVRPTSEAGANIFRTTSHSGYVEVNGPLLARNASPRALQVLAELLADESIDVAQRISVAHWGLLPNRANPDVAAMCARLLKGGVSREVELAIVESLYDYQPRLWFGVAAGQPSPPPWGSAPETAAKVLRSLAARLSRRPDLPAELRVAIRNTLKQLP